ncbi:hypothetical protein EDC04DRAFT_3118582 [Pisolithus marmoratus]|nr:hypothetical protein EDC04DRAFT_3118582 [Pisolithus marmoratus]
MASRPLLRASSVVRQVRRYRQPVSIRCSSSPSKDVQNNTQTPPVRQQSWLTQKVKSNPVLYNIFLGLARTLGYGSPQQLANRRALHLYNHLCAKRADEEAEFWKNGMSTLPSRSCCALPPTFQSWFTITNFHVWLLTVRLRSLPAPHGTQHIQGLIDHFFQDVEERVRYVLQPGVLPPRLPSPPSPNSPENSAPLPQVRSDNASYTSPYLPIQFYTPPSSIPPPDTFPSPAAYAKAQKRGRAPERIIVRQMKILKEQWAGLGMSMDLGLVRGDAELAAAVWRNLLGARGAAGVGLQNENGVKSDEIRSPFRRSVNLVGGAIDRVDKLDIDAEEIKDDKSGVHDFPSQESDRYISYPELMSTLVTYIRRETQRLEKVADSSIFGPRTVGRENEGIKALRWGPIRQ